MPAKPVFWKSPLTPNPMAPMPLGTVLPSGWLQDQLRLCAQGLSGQLHTFWPDVGDACAWLGGKGDDWERAPYYLDGLVPLAFLLGDETLLQEVQKRVEWLLASQREDGFFGPSSNPDWWPRAVAQKALMGYYSATGDKRVPLFLLKAFRYQAEHLDEQPLSAWGTARVGETVQVALWLYGLTEKRFLLSLCERLVREGLDWSGFCHTMPLKRPMARHLPWKALESGMREEGYDIRQPYTREHHFYHVVNVAMGLKTPALQYALTGGIKHREAFDAGFARLMKYHGVAYGMFTGDELLSGNAPTQGTELCAVAELMYTLESLLWTLGDASYGDLLEKLAYNALPATLSPDLKGHQYVQQANQVLVDEQPRPFYNNGPDANLFGLEPHFGCCTANLHQAFPKFAASLWMATREGGLCAISYAPNTLRYRLDGVPVRFDVESGYPFDGEVVLRFKAREAVRFPLSLRIPAWAEGAVVAVGEETDPAQPGTYHKLDRLWQHGDTVRLSLPMQVKTSRWYHQTLAVERGPLLLALSPGEAWQQVKDHPFAPDFAVSPTSPWNWALLPERGFTVHYDPQGVAPFKHGHALRVEAYGARIPGWDLEGGSAGSPPIDPPVAAEAIEAISLVPYGDTSLRISQFPVGQEQREA